jgi:tRNA(fMet)-specific endonuclease VapC
VRKAVLDTDVLSFILEKRNADLLSISRQYVRVHGFISISAVTVAEVVEGFEHIRNYVAKRDFLKQAEGFEVLAVGVEEGIVAGEIIGTLSRAGQGIGDLDPLVAAVAISNQLPLVTNNWKHYRRIVNLGFPLELENWLGHE